MLDNEQLHEIYAGLALATLNCCDERRRRRHLRYGDMIHARIAPDAEIFWYSPKVMGKAGRVVLLISGSRSTITAKQDIVHGREYLVDDDTAFVLARLRDIL